MIKFTLFLTFLGGVRNRFVILRNIYTCIYNKNST